MSKEQTVPEGASASERPGVWLRINSFDELMRHEREILDRIASTPNGGNLFMAHPLQCLEDLGVVLSEGARQEILRIEPHLSTLSPTPYLALKESRQRQRVRYHLHGLFRRRER